jgi:hypothetical protein
MGWVLQLIIFQIIFAEVITLIIYLLWRASHRGQKW